MWRDLIDKIAQQKLSLEYIQEGHVKPGDFISTTTTGYSPNDKKDDKPLFIADKLYKVIDVLREGDKPVGVVVNSEQGKWLLDARQSYIQYFNHVDLSPEERLGLLDVIPLEIMQFLDKYKEVPRTYIISELMQSHYSNDIRVMKKMKDDVTEAIYLLIQAGKIERGSRPGTYKLTLDAQRDLHEPLGNPHEQPLPGE